MSTMNFKEDNPMTNKLPRRTPKSNILEKGADNLSPLGGKKVPRPAPKINGADIQTPPPPPPRQNSKRGDGSSKSYSKLSLHDNSENFEENSNNIRNNSRMGNFEYKDQSKTLDEIEQEIEASTRSRFSNLDIELGQAQDEKSIQRASSSINSKNNVSAKTEIKSSRTTASPPNRFKGTNPLQYGLWAHYLAYGSAAMCLCMGIFAVLWTTATTYECKINGKSISNEYLFTGTTCPTMWTNTHGQSVPVCCNPDSSTDIQGFKEIGAVYIVYSLFIALYENTWFGFGLWFPNDTLLYAYKFSLIGICHILVGIIGLYNYATCLAGACLVITGLVYQYAAARNEAGDGGREVARKAAEAKSNSKNKQRSEQTYSQRFNEGISQVSSFNPISFFLRIYNEDKLSSYIWAFIFFALNFIVFVYTLNVWYDIVKEMRSALLDGTLDVTCSSRLCHVNRKAVRYGPISFFAPWAKAFGMCLNLDCALLLLPVVRLLLRKLNNWGESFNAQQQHNDILGKFLAHPMTRYIPLQKNIEFHKLCAMTIFFFAWGHMVFHWLNLWKANNVTLAFFRLAKWDGTDYFTGAVATMAMFFIFSAAPDAVRLSKYEIFFKSHHFFTLFYISLFIHGDPPVFFYFTIIPVLLYLTERYLQTKRGNRPYLVVKVEWIPPVMAIYFRPVFKEHFVFKEGQYLYLNCPAISPAEWHPFTISSATDDMNNNTRIHLETGEEVAEVPRPQGLPPRAKWNKYHLVSQDWRTMDPNDYLDKSETGFHDYVSVHVKVHGLEEPYARSWTRKLKEYFELMSPGKKFPFYFFRRDPRGEVLAGRQYGPDGETAILRVDGPHSAPAEHYARYGTLMLIGAGIGLTPCVSILTSLTKYRWKKNFNPELLHFYWIVRQNEIDSFQWLVHMLTDISYELKKSRISHQIERRYYAEINIYVTAASKERIEPSALQRPKKIFKSSSECSPTFTADELYEKMLNPTVDSRNQVTKMKDPRADNRLQDIWIWNGRPNWDEIFKDMKAQRQHSDIGVCFCGAPVIGADLRSMCEKYSSAEDDCLFSLHKENF